MLDHHQRPFPIHPIHCWSISKKEDLRGAEMAQKMHKRQFQPEVQNTNFRFPPLPTILFLFVSIVVVVPPSLVVSPLSDSPPSPVPIVPSRDPIVPARPPPPPPNPTSASSWPVWPQFPPAFGQPWPQNSLMGFPSLFPMAQPVSAEASTTVQRDEGTDEQQKKSPAEGTTDSNGTAEAIAPQKEQQFVGIRARFNPPTFDEIARLFYSVFNHEAQHIQIRPQKQCFPEGCFRLHTFRIVGFQRPRALTLKPLGPNLLLLNILSFDVDIESLLNGNIQLLLTAVPITGNFQANTRQLSIMALFDLQKDQNKVPYLRMASCELRSGSVSTKVSNLGLLTDSINLKYKTEMLDKARELITSTICETISATIRDRVNQMLRRLPRSISVATILAALGPDTSQCQTASGSRSATPSPPPPPLLSSSFQFDSPPQRFYSNRLKLAYGGKGGHQQQQQQQQQRGGEWNGPLWDGRFWQKRRQRRGLEMIELDGTTTEGTMPKEQQKEDEEEGKEEEGEEQQQQQGRGTVTEITDEEANKNLIEEISKVIIEETTTQTTRTTTSATTTLPSTTAPPRLSTSMPTSPPSVDGKNSSPERQKQRPILEAAEKDGHVKNGGNKEISVNVGNNNNNSSREREVRLREPPASSIIGIGKKKVGGNSNGGSGSSSKSCSIPGHAALLDFLDLHSLGQVFIDLDFVDSSAGADFFAVGLSGDVFLRVPYQVSYVGGGVREVLAGSALWEMANGTKSIRAEGQQEEEEEKEEDEEDEDKSLLTDTTTAKGSAEELLSAGQSPPQKEFPPILHFPSPSGPLGFRKNLELIFSDLTANLVLLQAHRAKLLKIRIGPESMLFGPMLKTTCEVDEVCLGDSVPEAGEKYPNEQLELEVEPVQPPRIKFTKDLASISLIGAATFFLARNKQAIARVPFTARVELALRMVPPEKRGNETTTRIGEQSKNRLEVSMAIPKLEILEDVDFFELPASILQGFRDAARGAILNSAARALASGIPLDALERRLCPWGITQPGIQLLRDGLVLLSADLDAYSLLFEDGGNVNNEGQQQQPAFEGAQLNRRQKCPAPAR